MIKKKHTYLITYSFTKDGKVYKGNNFVSFPKKLNTSERIIELKKLLALYEKVSWEAIMIEFIYNLKE